MPIAGAMSGMVQRSGSAFDRQGYEVKRGANEYGRSGAAGGFDGDVQDLRHGGFSFG